MKAVLIDTLREPEMIETDGSPNSLRQLIGDEVKPLGTYFGTRPLLWAGAKGAVSSPPNRVIFATDAVRERGYVPRDWAERTNDGDIVDLLFGPIVAIYYEMDESGALSPRDATEEDFDELCEALGDKRSGIVAAVAIAVMRDLASD